MTYAEILLPLPLNARFTYAVREELECSVKPGHRVIVPFGRRKFYTGIVTGLVNQPPEGIAVKEIFAALDSERPILRRPQLKLWEWLADYYLCSAGDVMRAALPAALKVESETFIESAPEAEMSEELLEGVSEREATLLQILSHEGKRMSLAEIEKQTGFRNIGPMVSRLLARGAVIISERLVERYRSRKVSYVRLLAERGDDARLHAMFDEVHRAKKQERVLLALLELSGFMRRDKAPAEVTLANLLERSEATRPIVKELERKGFVELYTREVNRFSFGGTPTKTLPTLSEAQQQALRAIHDSWKAAHEVVLLRGVTSSGKTEIYIHLIAKALELGRQALFLVPEIALTTQLTQRLQRVFGDSVVIYHSKFSDNERVDIWQRLLSDNKPLVVIGARSALFLPYADLGLVIVDEEHESSYKQDNPAPRYNGRDTAMVLARMHGAKVLLGTATPSVETYWKALNGKFGLVELTERYAGATLPEMRIIDTLRARRSGAMNGSIAEATRRLVSGAISEGNQAIIFINRRGYAPLAECRRCAYIPKCEQCDVSLTYHRQIDRMVCHYCGAQYPVPKICPSCGEPAVEIRGYGTERVEDEVEKTFPEAKVARMDLDTTRNKDGYQNIINDFSEGRADILVGTQMVTKGLDFKKVKAVAVVNADTLLSMPDFRASERAFNMLEQVAGRAGRRADDGVVAIQTSHPDTPLLPYILEHDYRGFYEHEIAERQNFNYPPFTRLVYVYLRHRDRSALEMLAGEYANRMRTLFGNRVFGPEEPTVSRVQLLYIRKIMLKIEVNASMQKVKGIMRDLHNSVMTSPLPHVKGLLVSYDVDPY